LDEITERTRWLWETYKQPALLEKYLSGREFTVGILGTGKRAQSIGALEISLRKEREVYGFDEKEACERLVRYDSFNQQPLFNTLTELALKTWRTLECRDGGRVDFRLDENGYPFVLEVNTLPGMHPTHSDLPMIATHAGMRFETLLEKILQSAMLRMN
jgi:D-alanine-D-alanine ligase